MPNEGERPTTADKGKGKVDDVRELNGKKPQKDEKAPVEGKKKDEEPQEGRSRHHRGGKHLASATLLRSQDLAANIIQEELSEEDQELKNELEMLVERLKVCLLP